MVVATERRHEAIRLRETGLTYAEIGRQIGVTKERVRQYIMGKPPQPKVDIFAKSILRVSEAALLLALHPNTLRRWSNKGIVKSHCINSRGDRRFRKEDIKNFLEGLEHT